MLGLICISSRTKKRRFYTQMWIIQLLKEPYPLNNIRKMTWLGAYVAVFVFLFLLFFQPFGLSTNSQTDLLSIAASFGAITFASVVLGTLAIRTLFPSFFQENRWTFGRELAITMYYFVLVGIFNLLYSDFRFGFGLTIVDFLYFQAYTLGVGFFPIVIYMLVKYTRLLKMNTNEASVLSDKLVASQASDVAQTQQALVIRSELKKDDLAIKGIDFVYAESADNYVTVNYLANSQLQKSLVRTTLAKLEQDVGAFPQIVRCHRAFVANLDHLVSFKGNAQGLQLSLRHTNTEVPVSRKMVNEIKLRLNSQASS